MTEEKKGEFIDNVIEEKKEKTKEIIKKIRMKKNYKVSYRSGWLLLNTNYSSENIEGGLETAKKLIEGGYAVEIDEKEKTSFVSAPILPVPLAERKTDLSEVRRKAKNRRA